MGDAVASRPGAWAWRTGFRSLLPAGPRSGLVILIFHRVLRERDPLQPNEPTAEEFERQLLWVRDWFNILPLSEAVRRLADDTLPERPLAITFDDGYADNHEVALPTLQRFGLPATFFIAAGYLDGGRMFNDTVIEAIRRAPGPDLDLCDVGLGVLSIADDAARRDAIAVLLERVKYLPRPQREEQVQRIGERIAAEIPGGLMMRSEQVADLCAAGMEIGAHTLTHPILEEGTLDDARREIVAGRERLQAIVGRRIGLFAYPNGKPGRDYAAEHVSLVRGLGFDAAVSTARGVARSGADVFQLPRFTPWDRTGFGYGARLARTIVQRGYATV